MITLTLTSAEVRALVDLANRGDQEIRKLLPRPSRQRAAKSALAKLDAADKREFDWWSCEDCGTSWTFKIGTAPRRCDICGGRMRRGGPGDAKKTA